ncbi:MAG TPA: asparagine synthase (glutamine-hydrolyzing) [Alphaproteobacteria bacterium]|nr:asparagine synthase (glutamine-hydrolyzing) [Alphaproteobacteria bacterium]
MCGIAGILNLDGAPAEAVILQDMAAAIRHRGPDSEGFYVDGALGFGHRRLAIIDLSPAGHQPMATADGRFVINYNGEVYNFQELRVELEARGHRFRSRSDTEVLLEAWAAWGPGALSRFNGMFAFALYDRKERRLFLARDRYGIKPLYYVLCGDTLLFASEIKAFLRHPDFRAALDPKALVEYLTFQNFLTERTLFQGVNLLPAGCALEIGAQVAAPGRLSRYWDFRFAEAAQGDRPALVEELDRLFRQAVSRQLVSDVPVSAYLSGGMDTGSITALAARQLPHLQSFTIGFDLSSASGLELAFDERAQAERLSYLFGTEHYEMVLKAGDMERCLADVIWHMEEPRVGQSYPNYYAAKLAGKFGKVVLSGTGGDELFGGYPWRYYRAAVNVDFDDYVSKYYAFWQRLLPVEAAERVFAPLGVEGRVDTEALFRQVFVSHEQELSRPEDYINHSLYFEAKTFLHGLLVVEDKLSMAHSLETRVPFLDNDLVDFAQAVPIRFKLGNLGEVVRFNENEPGSKTAKYFEKTRDGKLILREAMRRHIPAEYTGAIKQGFSAPDASWYRGESIDYVREKLLLRQARIYDFVDRDVIRGLVSEHLEGRQNRRLLIWSLLCLEQWCAQFLDGAGGSPAKGLASRGERAAPAIPAVSWP